MEISRDLVTEFACGLFREGEGNDLPDRGVPVDDQFEVPLHKDAGLAGSRVRSDAQVSVQGESLALAWRQAVHRRKG